MGTWLDLTKYHGDAPDDADAVLFRLERGDGDWAGIVDPAAGTEREGAHRYEEIFASADARPVAESSEYVFAITIELDPSIDLREFDEWYDGTHVPVVGTVGLTRGRRFRDTEHPRRFLALYDMANAGTLESAPLQEVRGFDHFSDRVAILERMVLHRATRDMKY